MLSGVFSSPLEMRKTLVLHKKVMKNKKESQFPHQQMSEKADFFLNLIKIYKKKVFWMPFFLKWRKNNVIKPVIIITSVQFF